MSADIEYPIQAVPDAGGMLEVVPGVHWLRMPLPFALDHINLWLLEDGDHWTLVDTGVGLEDVRALWMRVLSERLDGRPLGRIIVTHFHPDHIGQAAWLSRRFDAPVLMTQGEFTAAGRLHHTDPEINGRELAELFARHGLDGKRARAVASRGGQYRRLVPELPEVVQRIREGESLEIGGRAWRVLIGRGHSPEHAPLYCPELDLLIAGDQVLPTISTNVSVWPADPDADPLAAYLDSLEGLAGLPPTVCVLPSHGRVFRGLHARIDQLREHHRERLERLRLACHLPRSAADVLTTLFSRELDPHQLQFAMGEAIAHLNRLQAAGEVQRIEGDDGVLRFRCALTSTT